MDGGKLYEDKSDRALCIHFREYTETLKGALE